MNGYSLDLIFPMLQFLAVHAGYTLYWASICMVVSNLIKRLPICIIAGGISAVFHQHIVGARSSLFVHVYVAWLILIVYIFMTHWLRRNHIEQQFGVIVDTELSDQEKSIMEAINNLRESDQLTESSLEKIYNENKEFIDSNSLLKCQLFNEVINWRKQKNVKFRALIVAGQRQFVDVNFRSVDWLK